MVEEEEGVFGLWATYLLAGVGGCIASYLTSPHTHTTSLGASGAVFGCFMVGVLTKFQPSIRKLLEMAILGTFVSQQVSKFRVAQPQMNAGCWTAGLDNQQAAWAQLRPDRWILCRRASPASGPKAEVLLSVVSPCLPALAHPTPAAGAERVPKRNWRGRHCGRHAGRAHCSPGGGGGRSAAGGAPLEAASRRGMSRGF